MYCTQCGKEIPDGEMFCPGCGSRVGTPLRPVPKRTSGLAITSLILAFLPVPLVAPLAAIAIGALALERIGKDENVGGRVLATIAVVSGTVFLLLSLIGCAVFLPALARAREQARRAVCVSNLKQIALAMMMYAQDYREYYPPDMSVLYPSYVSWKKTFICPSTTATEQDVSENFSVCYGYVSGMNIQDPGDCILACDKENNHRGDGVNVLFNTGYVKWVDARELPNLWDEHNALLQTRKQRRY